MPQAPSDVQETTLAQPVSTLTIPEEPVELRVRTRHLAESSPAEAAELIAGGYWIAEQLWGEWADALTDASMDRAAFVDTVRSYRLELWLWVMGERTWQQCAEGLAGRLVRRLAA